MTSLPRSIDMAARDPIRAYAMSPFGMPYLEAMLTERRRIVAQETAEMILDLTTEPDKIADTVRSARSEINAIAYALQFIETVRAEAIQDRPRSSGVHPIV